MRVVVPCVLVRLFIHDILSTLLICILYLCNTKCLNIHLHLSLYIKFLIWYVSDPRCFLMSSKNTKGWLSEHMGNYNFNILYVSSNNRMLHHIRHQNCNVINEMIYGFNQRVFIALSWNKIVAGVHDKSECRHLIITVSKVAVNISTS